MVEVIVCIVGCCSNNVRFLFVFSCYVEYFWEGMIIINLRSFLYEKVRSGVCKFEFIML